jgi:hypothetical protein
MKLTFPPDSKPPARRPPTLRVRGTTPGGREGETHAITLEVKYLKLDGESPNTQPKTEASRLEPNNVTTDPPNVGPNDGNALWTAAGAPTTRLAVPPKKSLPLTDISTLIFPTPKLSTAH